MRDRQPIAQAKRYIKSTWLSPEYSPPRKVGLTRRRVSSGEGGFRSPRIISFPDKLTRKLHSLRWISTNFSNSYGPRHPRIYILAGPEAFDGKGKCVSG